MAKRKRALKRKPRDTTLALTPCMSYDADGKCIGEFKPKPRKNKTSVVTLPNGKMIVRVSNL